MNHRDAHVLSQDEVNAKLAKQTAPKITPERLEEVITKEEYHVFPGNCLTVCVLTLKNGFTVTGESACASPENFDEEIGRSIARRNAKDKIWALEGYLLKQKLYEIQSGNFITRLIQEKADLMTKVEKLGVFLGSGASQLGVVEFNDLVEQHEYMQKYLHVVSRRLERLGHQG